MGIHLWVSMAWIYGMQIFFTPIINAFGWSRAAVSGAFALQRLEGSIASPLEGFLLDRFGPRRMIIVGASILGLGLISLSFLRFIWMFYASVLLVSLGASATSGMPRNWAIVQWFRRKRGRALGIGSSGAVLSGPLLIIVVWLVENVGWRPAFVVLGIATWCVCIPLALVFRSTPQEHGLLPDGDPPKVANQASSQGVRQQVGHSQPTTNDGSLTAIQALRSPIFWLLSVVFGAQTMGVSGLMVHLIPYFQSIGFSTSEAASVLGAFTLLSVFGRLGGGWAMDYFDRRLVLATLLGCLSVSFLLLANINAYWQIVPFALLYGTAFGGMIPARSAIVSSYFGTQNFGAIQGLTQSITVLAGMVSPVLMGFVFDVTESYVLSFYILMIVAGLAIPMTLLARPPKLSVEMADNQA
ncbi:MFS transporter [SAR202 cluster bacterium AC-647-N09_OGT_505m]|nr:MFS transporter [SAR202 cluster bacterium AC-647-N09_OGT_505m]